MTGILLACGLALTAQAQDGPLYQNNLDRAAVGSLPEDMMLIEGGFTVVEDQGNKFIELPGAPLETFSLLFGPAEKENIVVTARIHGTGKGRRFPSFGISSGGQGGYRLQVAPGKKAVELHRGDQLKVTVPFEWKSGQWTRLKLQVRKVADGQWKIEGKAWPDGAPEPAEWTIACEDTQATPNGRAGIWGSPFAGTPIRFDDLSVLRARP